MADSKELAGQRVDPAEEPSAGWGWHGGFPKGTQAAGWGTVAVVLFMLFFGHESVVDAPRSVANLWLMGIALVVVIGLLLDLRRKRRARHGGV